MRLLDKIALNRLISIITNFIITMVKLFKPSDKNDIVPQPPVRRRPIKDLLDKWKR